MIGRTLGHYKILDRLGAGGMGVVWLAEDLALGRRVALKMLRDDVAASPEKRARFEREARSVAALNHPNIVTLYSVEEADGVRFLAMEYVPGRTLDDLLRPGGLPVGDLLRIGDGIAAALDGWSERALDRLRLPHPALGKLTVREIVLFTLYHNIHHATNVARRRAR